MGGDLLKGCIIAILGDEGSGIGDAKKDEGLGIGDAKERENRGERIFILSTSYLCSAKKCDGKMRL